MNLIEAKFFIEKPGPPSYYLGNDYNWSADEKTWSLVLQPISKNLFEQLRIIQ